MKILIVEDQLQMVDTLTTYLERSGYICEVATNYEKAEEKIGVYTYDCILLDITLPGGNGLNLLTLLRKQRTNTGVIILSAKDSVDDRITGLQQGADDYLPKPFHLSELNARLQALFRRLKFEGNHSVHFENMEIDIESQKVRINATELVLTKKEYELLLFFASNPERVLSKTALAEHIWGDNSDQSDSFDFLYSQIKNLRRKLSEASAFFTIQAVYGLGYKLFRE
ncbi:response regulator transcription factor [Xanthocytophaga agilis]|uniref:Response regulator transcription factor n=1 Tax=Xanthocytophaga agilis TaxID=3048010 RepID=A0AAE3RDS2_9BACT|nr:response regulator transcription factor [Xanthocytophaga agilis]MDJ1506874.1 response regulator transcription factor [Xanthocytophaga agilis]